MKGGTNGTEVLQMPPSPWAATTSAFSMVCRSYEAFSASNMTVSDSVSHGSDKVKLIHFSNVVSDTFRSAFKGASTTRPLSVRYATSSYLIISIV